MTIFSSQCTHNNNVPKLSHYPVLYTSQHTKEHELRYKVYVQKVENTNTNSVNDDVHNMKMLSQVAYVTAKNLN